MKHASDTCKKAKTDHKRKTAMSKWKINKASYNKSLT